MYLLGLPVCITCEKGDNAKRVSPSFPLSQGGRSPDVEGRRAPLSNVGLALQTEDPRGAAWLLVAMVHGESWCPDAIAQHLARSPDLGRGISHVLLTGPPAAAVPLLAVLIAAIVHDTGEPAYVTLVEALLYGATQREELPVRMGCSLVLHHVLKGVHAQDHRRDGDGPCQSGDDNGVAREHLASLGLYDLVSQTPTVLAAPFVNRMTLNQTLDSWTEADMLWDKGVWMDIGHRGYDRIDETYLALVPPWDGT